MPIKVILEPTVTVLALPVFFEHPKYELPGGADRGTSAERLIAHAGKGCYDSYGKDGRSVGQHIAGLVASGHGSVLEHANISLFIEGISRGCSHEIVRHRAGFAFSQRSTRYTTEDDAAMVLDSWYANEYAEHGESAIAHLKDHFARCLALYGREVHRLLKLRHDAELNPLGSAVEIRKWARGKARQVLPHSLETRMTMTGNLRAWRHFIEQRTHPSAEDEIRRLGYCVYLAIRPLAPAVFADYAPTTDEVGYVTSSSRKV